MWRSMTNTKDVSKYIAMLLVAVGPSGSPSSHVWMAVDPQMADVYQYQTVLLFMQKSGVVEVSNHFVTLTRKGMEMHNKIVEILTR